MKNFLSALGLEQYIETFEKNGITSSTLKDLSNDDLKDIGVEILGHRKQILGAIKEQEKKKASVEKVFYDQTVNIVNGGVATVKITSHRAILGEKTYSLQNIAAVEAFSNVAEVDAAYRAALKDWEAQKAVANQPKIQGILLIGLGLVMFVMMAADGEAGAGLMGGGCCVLVGLASMAKAVVPPEPVRGNVIWSVRLQASGTSTGNSHKDTVRTPCILSTECSSQNPSPI